MFTLVVCWRGASSAQRITFYEADLSESCGAMGNQAYTRRFLFTVLLPEVVIYRSSPKGGGIPFIAMVFQPVVAAAS